MRDSVLKTAEAYINAGLRVLPCNGKAPKINKWQESNLTIDEFRKYYRENDNIGIITGKTTGIVCVDIDAKNDGLNWYSFFESDLGNPIVEHTGGGGIHLYYRYPEKINFIKSRINWAQGVDILADGGKQVITYPSVHASGNKYIINDGYTLLDMSQADFLPDWIYKDLISNQKVKQQNDTILSNPENVFIDQAIEVIKNFPPAIEGQGGDFHTLKAAMILRDYGITQDLAFNILNVYFNPRCIPQWEPTALKIKVMNAYKYAHNSPGVFLPENQFSIEPEIENYRPETDPHLAGKKDIEKKTVKSEIKTLSIHDFLKTNFNKKEHYIGPFVKQGISLVYAATGVGKTHFCIGLAFAIASGGDFLRWKSEEKARVLYIDGELPAYYLKNMLEPLYLDSKDKNISFDIITPDTQNDSIMPNLASVEGQESIRTAVENADVIFVDNLSTLVRSGKENEAEYWLPIQTWFLKLRRMGKSVIFVHHAGKGEGGSFRGTSKITDAVDLSVFLKSPIGHKSEDGCVFEVKFPKYRHYRKGDATEFIATYTQTEFGSSWSCKDLEEENSNKILELYDSGMKVKEIAIELGLSLKTIYKHLKTNGVECNEPRGKKPRKDLGDDDF